MKTVFLREFIFFYLCGEQVTRSLEIADVANCEGEFCYRKIFQQLFISSFKLLREVRKYVAPENATTGIKLSISSLRGVSESQMGQLWENFAILIAPNLELDLSVFMTLTWTDERLRNLTVETANAQSRN